MKWWWLTLARYALPQWRGLTLMGALMLLGVAAALLRPWPLKLIVDDVLAGDGDSRVVTWMQVLPGAATARGQIVWLALATVALFLVRQSVLVAQKYVEAGIGSRMTYRLASDLFDQIQRRSLLFHFQQRVGDLVKRVTRDTTCVANLVLGVYLPVATSLITLVSLFFVMWRLSPTLALLAIGMALPLGLIIRWSAATMSDRRYREMQLQGQVVALAEQTLTALPVVQSFNRERAGDESFRDLAGQTVQANLGAAISEARFKISTATVSAIASAGVMLIGGIYVLRGDASVGTLLVVIAYFAALYSPMEALAYLGGGFATAAAGARRVSELLELEHDSVQDAPGAVPMPVRVSGQPCGGIEIQRVTFGYRRDQAVLHEISLQIRPGERVALVGPSGGGKSTLVSLLARLYDPWEGQISVDGTDIREITLKSLRDNVAIVPQEPFLLPLSVADNIAYGRPSASRHEVIEAARAASAHEFIERLPEGYDTVIGERGSTLSGGEQQRLSIARALLKNAPILILDEPTSSLDAGTEASLLDAFQRLMRGRTSIVIAHRLSTIRGSDRIVVLDRGKIVEQGTHKELIEADGLYRRLYEKQFDASGPEAA